MMSRPYLASFADARSRAAAEQPATFRPRTRGARLRFWTSLTGLPLLALGCAEESAHESDRDAKVNAAEARDSAAQAANIFDAHPAKYDAAAEQALPRREIYASNECPARLLRSDLELQPTTYCAGRTSECWQEASCRNSDDCTERPFGRCAGGEHAEDAGYISFTRCEYDECVEDSDCASGKACVCGVAARICAAAPCRKDEDCPERQACIRSDVCGLGPYGDFLCTSERDECRSNDDCDRPHDLCTFDGEHLVCAPVFCDV